MDFPLSNPIPEALSLHSSLRGKVYAITGGTSGMGLSAARLLVAAGASVSICGRTPSKVDAARAELVALHEAVSAPRRSAAATEQKQEKQSTAGVSTAAFGPDPLPTPNANPLPSPPLSEPSENSDNPAGSPVLAACVDVAKADEVDAWIAATVAQFGRLDGAVNSAAIEQLRMQPVAEFDDENWDAVLAANLTGVMYSMRAQIRAMLLRIERAQAEGRPAETGVVVNVTSILASVSFPMNAAYVAAKHGVMGLTKTAARDYGAKGIRVNAMSPGFCRTALLENAERKLGVKLEPPQQIVQQRISEAFEMARPIAFLLSDYSTYMTGQDVMVDGGWIC